MVNPPTLHSKYFKSEHNRSETWLCSLPCEMFQKNEYLVYLYTILYIYSVTARTQQLV